MSNPLIAIMKKYSNKTLVTIPKNENCDLFWGDLISDMYYNYKLEEMGMDVRIRDILRSFQNQDSLDVINKQGRILKRLAKHYKEIHGEKLTDEIQGIIGDRLQYYLTNRNNPTNFVLDFTDVFDWEDGQFGKSNSCWWGCYSDSLPTFESGGGWAVRFYSDLEDRSGIGRTWIFPYDNKTLVCFNSYGITRAYVSKSIKQLFFQEGVTLHYKRVAIYNSQNESIPYINDEAGFILYTEEAELQDDYDLNLEVESDGRKKCHSCGRRIEEREENYINDDCYCDRCTNELFSFCPFCEEYCSPEVVHELKGYKYHNQICRYCAESNDYEMCNGCDCYTVESVQAEDTDDYYCPDCQSDLYHCESCDLYYTDRGDCPNCTEEEEEEEEEDSANSESVELERDFITRELETVRIAQGSYSNLVEVAMDVYRHESIAGLYVNRDPNKDINVYSVTHEMSGAAVFHVKTLDLALLAMERIAGLTDWLQPSATITSNKDAMRRLLETKRDLA